MTEWYYRLGEDVQGPVSETDLDHIFQTGALSGETRVWCEGMKDWAIATELTGFSRHFNPAPPSTASARPPIIPTQTVAAKKIRLKPAVVVGGILLVGAALYFGQSFHSQKSPEPDSSATSPQNVQEPESTQDDFITADPRTITNPYMTTDLYGPAVSGNVSSIPKSELDLVESRGLSEQQSIYTVLLIHKFRFQVSDVLSEWDDLETKRGKWDDRNIDLWNSFTLNAFLEGKKNRETNN